MVDAETSVLVDTVDSAAVFSVVDTVEMGVNTVEVVTGFTTVEATSVEAATVDAVGVAVSVELNVVVVVIGVNLTISCADAGVAAARMPSAMAEQSAVPVPMNPLTNPS